MSHFTSTAMTPRAWRLIAYISIGMACYGSISILETALDCRLRIIDARLKAAEEMQYANGMRQENQTTNPALSVERSTP
jgi:hypothetical protein